ncbi:trypsin-like peptidase domain-containing protein [Hydrogenimonas sp.]
MLTTNILQRVFKIRYNDNYGTAYTIEKGYNQFLVTAWHIFDNASDINEIEIYHNNQWNRLKVEVAHNFLDDIDVIVFRLEYDLSPKYEVEIGMQNIIYGTWAYFLGFPFGISHDDGGINKGYPIPFIKAALISNIKLEGHGYNTVFLDGHNNKGFSGGPAIWIPPNSKKIQIIGTVTEYKTEHPIHHKTKEELPNFEYNAGIVIVKNIQNILDFLS